MIVEPHIAPALLDKVTQTLKDNFLDSFDWLEQCYGLAQVGIVMRDNREYRFPVVYRNDGSTFQKELHPDQGLMSFGFFELNTPYNRDFNIGEFVYNLNFVCWLNLPKIDASRPDDFTSLLTKQVIERIEKKVGPNSISVEPRHENIFNRYDYSQSEKQFMKYPYSGFKIGFEFADIC